MSGGVRMRRDAASLGWILVANRLLTEEQLRLAEGEQHRTLQPLGEILVEKGWVSKKRWLQALAAHRGVSAWHLEVDKPDPAATRLLAVEACREHRILPVRRRGDLLLLAMVNPSDIEAIELARNLTRLRIEPVLADETLLAEAIEDTARANHRHRALEVGHLVIEAVNQHSERGSPAPVRENLSEADSRPVVELVNQIISTAIDRHASDVHIEPRYDRVEVRFRLDGELVEAMEVPVGIGPALATRVKIMSELDIVEYRLPQDGQITVEHQGRQVDLRVSVLPTKYGQRIVLRVLDRRLSLRPLEELGFSIQELDLFRSFFQRPHGLVLVTGPTGSGKTTTLYAALQELNDGRRNIMTCEDPIEYDLDGVNQSQVNEKVGLTFAAQLRAVLRQDPDVILVGEIRDSETAETALRAAMTGHLVLSTLHTNDAPSAVPRLLDIGVDPYLLGTCLTGVTAQRLARRLCPKCAVAGEPDRAESAVLAALGAPGSSRVLRPGGCASCFGTGYSGRFAVHELLPMPEAVARLVSGRRPVEEIAETASNYGYNRLRETLALHVTRGETSLEEALKIAGSGQPTAPPLDLAA
ncbi:MAG: type II/IV secretion system protein [Fimbriimonadaceae bacterium]|nr:type II/IV secretion system protein [Fimbriimonadaceae bacterium]QYK56065.1 MAG: type II/IV secretion system protein [Fimbriimonadaceae bacterium]